MAEDDWYCLTRGKFEYPTVEIVLTNVTNPTSDFEHPNIQEPGFLLRVDLYDGIEALFDKILISSMLTCMLD